MKVEVATAISDLQRQFNASTLNSREDGDGGAYVTIDPIELPSQFSPRLTWVGFHIPAQYPYADIYPVFIGADVKLVDGTQFTPPITSGHQFEQRPALQISRRNSAAQTGLQKAPAKILKVLDFLARLR